MFKFLGYDTEWYKVFEYSPEAVCLGGTYFGGTVERSYPAPYSRVRFVEECVIPPPDDDLLDLPF